MSFRNQNLDIKARPLKLDFQTSGATHLTRMATSTQRKRKAPENAIEGLDLAYEMHDGTVKTVRMYIGNLPDKTCSGKTVSSGSVHWGRDMAEELRGYFILHGVQRNQIEAVILSSGPFGLFFEHDKKHDMCMQLLDKKGKYPDTGDMAIVPALTCFCENAGEEGCNYQFSMLVNSSQQGKEQGLGNADENTGVFTLHSQFLKPPMPRRISKGLSGGISRGRSSTTFNAEAGFGAYTGSSWDPSDQDPASEMKTFEFRVKVQERDTDNPVLFASDLEEARKKYGPSGFVPDDVEIKQE